MIIHEFFVKNLQLFFQIVIFCSVVLGFYKIYYIIYNQAGAKEKHNNMKESTYRLIALIFGVTLYSFSKVANLSIPDLLTKAINLSNPFFSIPFKYFLPSLLGFFCIHYLFKKYEKDNFIAVRLTILFFTLLLFILLDTFLLAFNKRSDENFIPSGLFVISGILKMFLTTPKKNNDEKNT